MNNIQKINKDILFDAMVYCDRCDVYKDCVRFPLIGKYIRQRKYDAHIAGQKLAMSQIEHALRWRKTEEELPNRKSEPYIVLVKRYDVISIQWVYYGKQTKEMIKELFDFHKYSEWRDIY